MQRPFAVGCRAEKTSWPDGVRYSARSTDALVPALALLQPISRPPLRVLERNQSSIEYARGGAYAARFCPTPVLGPAFSTMPALPLTAPGRPSEMPLL